LQNKGAVFLDRDGVVNDNRKLVNKPEDLILYSWTAQAIRRLNDAHFPTFIVTNQGGIELGYFTSRDLENIHACLKQQLQTANAHIDDIVYCPHYHHPCECRKPKPGMLLHLAQKHQIDLKLSWMIGDREPDILAGASAGCHTIKLGEHDVIADYYCENLRQAVETILQSPLRLNDIKEY